MSLVEQEPAVSQPVAFELRVTARVLSGAVVVQLATTGDKATEEDARDALDAAEKTVAKLKTKILSERGETTVCAWKRTPP